MFTSTGDMRELVCEEVRSPEPERYPGRIPPGKAALAVELYLVEPFLSFRQLVDQSRIHRLYELHLVIGGLCGFVQVSAMGELRWKVRGHPG